jgi:hypothetical protein
MRGALGSFEPLGAEDLGMDALGRDASRQQAGGQLAHPRRRTADVIGRSQRNAEVLQHLKRHMALGAVVAPWRVRRSGTAVANVRSCVGQRGKVLAYLVRERVVGAVARSDPIVKVRAHDTPGSRLMLRR